MGLNFVLRQALGLVVLSALSLSASEGQRPEGKKEGWQKREPNPQEMAERMVEGLEKGLDLTADQKQKVMEIVKGSAAEMFELKKKMQKLERESNEKVRVLLDDEQKERFDMMRAHRRMGMGGQGMMGQGMMGKGQRWQERRQRQPPGSEASEGQEEQGPGEPPGEVR